MNLDYWTTNGLHAEITRLGRRVAELEAENARFAECMRRAGLQAFMRDKPPEEIAAHLRMVMDSYITKEGEQERAIAASRARAESAEAESARLRAWLDEAHEEAERASNQARAEREMSAIDSAALLKEIERLREQIKVAEGLLFEWATGYPNEAATTHQFLGREDRP